ncbi:MAG TPA: CRTAC1 family protein [Thermoanaerobaculia bacterium]|nr:CRTAC1 family protein [Thermoanaerobaculia bacterium]
MTGRTGRAVVLLAAVATAPPLVSGVLHAASAPSLRFTEVSEAWGIDFRHRHGGTGEFFMVETMGSGVAIFDYDGDGDPDVLFVDGGVLPGYQGDPPRTRLFRNDSVAGAPRFVDVTERAGIVVSGWGMGAVAADVDGDGHLDLYVTTFGQRNQLFRNRGDGTFEDVSTRSGVDESLWSASAAFGDLDGDGWFDLLSTHLDQQTNAVYGNVGGGVFVDRRFASRLAEPSVPMVGFGVVFADLDHDGDIDVVVANRHIIHNVELYDRGTTFRQRNQAFANEGDGTFREVLDAGLDVVESSRGLAAGDLDLDGALDLVVNNSNARCEVYRNIGAAGGVLSIALRKQRTANRDAIGARIELWRGERVAVRELRAGSSYLSQNALPAHFGLGRDARVSRLVVRWPDGERIVLRDLPASQRLLLVRVPATATEAP